MESDAEGQQELLLKQSHVARWVEPQLLATLSVEGVGCAKDEAGHSAASARFSLLA